MSEKIFQYKLNRLLDENITATEAEQKIKEITNKEFKEYIASKFLAGDLDELLVIYQKYLVPAKIHRERKPVSVRTSVTRRSIGRETSIDRTRSSVERKVEIKKYREPRSDGYYLVGLGTINIKEDLKEVGAKYSKLYLEGIEYQGWYITEEMNEELVNNGLIPRRVSGKVSEQGGVYLVDYNENTYALMGDTEALSGLLKKQGWLKAERLYRNDLPTSGWYINKTNKNIDSILKELKKKGVREK